MSEEKKISNQDNNESTETKVDSKDKSTTGAKRKGKRINKKPSKVVAIIVAVIVAVILSFIYCGAIFTNSYSTLPSPISFQSSSVVSTVFPLNTNFTAMSL